MNKRPIRTADLVRLFESSSEPRTAVASRAALADALEQRGMKDLAAKLRRFPPRGLFEGSLLQEKVRRAIFEPRPHTPRRGGRPSTYSVRTSDLARLFYATTEDEMNLRPTRENDRAARSVLADALEERGMVNLATSLRRFPPDAHFGSTLLREKIRRAIFGPQKRQLYTVRKPVTDILLASVVGPRYPGWYEVYHVYSDNTGSRAFLFRTGYGGRYLVRDTRNEGEALEAAAERWPKRFAPPEDDPEDESYLEDLAVFSVNNVRRARVLEPSGSGYQGTAIIAGTNNIGVVEYR